MKKFLSLIILALYVVGSIGGIGYASYCGEYLVAFAVFALSVMAYPTARKYHKKMMENG